MRRTALLLTLTTTAALSFGATTAAEDWPNWRGPERSGVSTESGWVVNGKTTPRWSKNLGLGYGSFVVSDGKLITNGFSEDKGHDIIYCLDADSGSELWTRNVPSEKHAKFHGGGTLSTPTIDGDHVYVLHREGKVLCLKLADGSVVWQKNLATDAMDIEVPTWMFSASPLVIDDTVYINVGRVLAMNKSNGEITWKSKKTGHAYSTPHPFSLDDGEGLVVFNGDGLMIMNRKDGSVVATYPWKTRYDVNAATPIVLGDRIFISSGYNHGCAMVEFKDGSLEPVWESKVMRNQMSGSVLWNDHLYGFDDATLKCIDLDGNEKWAQRGLGQGSLMIADGKLIVNSSKGELILAEASPAGYKELYKQNVLKNGRNVQCWTMPVLANGLIYCRNSHGHVVCMDHRRSAG